MSAPGCMKCGRGQWDGKGNFIDHGPCYLGPPANRYQRRRLVFEKTWRTERPWLHFQFISIRDFTVFGIRVLWVYA